MHIIILHFDKDARLRLPKPMVNFSLFSIQPRGCPEDTDAVSLRLELFRAVKGLRFCPTCDQQVRLPQASRKLPEDVRL